MADVIPIDKDTSLPCAICPECKCEGWLIVLKSFLADTDDIVAFECLNCGYRIEIAESEEEVTLFEMEDL